MTEEQEQAGKASSMLSKKRYAALAQALVDEFADEGTVERALCTVRRVMGFDPEASAYTPKQAAANRAWRAKKLEEGRQEGKSSYEVLGRRAAYMRSKSRPVAAVPNAPTEA